jgi:cysteine desulfurase
MLGSKSIYMDNHATTPLDPRVLDTMLPYFKDSFGNPASRNHSFGREAEAAVEQARERVAGLIHADAPEEVVFTSGATESDNLAIKGVVEAYGPSKNHVVTVATEHKAVLETCAALERKGLASITYLPVQPSGLLDLEMPLRNLSSIALIGISIELQSDDEPGARPESPVLEHGLEQPPPRLAFRWPRPHAFGNRIADGWPSKKIKTDDPAGAHL